MAPKREEGWLVNVRLELDQVDDNVYVQQSHFIKEL